MELEDKAIEKLFLAAIANPNIATGQANERKIVEWFGNDSTGITRHQIMVRQALEFAEAAAKELLDFSRVTHKE